MAPRSAKGKKTADVKVTENTKKGRKGKQVADTESTEMELDEKSVVTEKNTKRGKKMANADNQINDTNEGPPAKKTKRNKVTDEQTNGDKSALEIDEALVVETELEDDKSETNGHTGEHKEITGRGRKKQSKKETVQNKSKEVGKGKKVDSQENDEFEKQDIVEEKPKSSGRGRTRKAPSKLKYDSDTEDKAENLHDEVKPVTKGRKKQIKANKEKTPEIENETSENPEDKDVVKEGPKQKEVKGRKNQGKKAQPKEHQGEIDENISEEPEIPKKRKGAKKDEKSKGDSKEEEATEEKVSEPKPARGRRGQKNVPIKPSETEEDIQDTGETTNKRRRKPIEEKAQADEGTKKKAPPKNKVFTNYEDIDFSCTSKTSQGKEWNFKIATWNVDGIRAWNDKGGLDYLKYEKPDILCLQEIKCSKEKLPKALTTVPGYHAYWLCSEQDGYAGVGIYTTQLAMNVQYGLQDEELDSEGRIITAEYEQFYLVCTYVPNAGRKLITMPKRLKWNEEFRKHVKSLDKKKPVIICGDMNVSHNEIDLANPKTNRKNAGFTDEERQGMTDLLGEGFVDTYRHLYPDRGNAYTFWTYMSNCRAKNVGWRLDYFIVSERLLSSLCDSIIRAAVFGSDHCPVTLFLHLSGADKPKE